MDIHQAQRLVHKISLLLEDAQHSGELTGIDRDVLLAYIRNLYEIFLNEKKSEKPVPEVIPSEVSFTKTELTPANPVQELQEVTELPLEVKQPEDRIATPVPPQITETPVQITTTPVHATPALPVAEEQKPRESREESQAVPGADMHAEALAEMFAELTIRDLSDKLSMAPISDLNKTMGLNERMLTQQELFGNQAQVFQDTLNALNSCKNFEEAKEYLIRNIIYVYHWTSDAKIKKATNFVKLVRRRFQ